MATSPSAHTVPASSTVYHAGWCAADENASSKSTKPTTDTSATKARRFRSPLSRMGPASIEGVTPLSLSVERETLRGGIAVLARDALTPWGTGSPERRHEGVLVHRRRPRRAGPRRAAPAGARPRRAGPTGAGPTGAGPRRAGPRRAAPRR